VATGFIPNVMYTPYYVAQDLGYYKAAGLDVEMNYDRVADLMSPLAQGKYTFAITSGDTIAPARAQGIPVRYVMAQYQKYPIGAMTLANGGIPLNSPSDLKGHNIGVSATNGPTYIGLRALLKAGKLKESDITVSAVGFAETEALINHQIDAAMTFIDNEPVQARALGYPVKVMPVSKYVSLVGTGVATSDGNIKHHSKMVQAFVTATLKGLRYTLQHTSAAFKIAMKRQPEVTDPQQIQIQRDVLSARLKFQQPPKGHPLGWSNPKSWQATIKFLRSMGVINQSVKVKTVYTTIFTNHFAVKADI
jgi:NitT/TauT family transport system substrate-binding protein